MPAWRLSETPCTVQPFDVLGECRDNPDLPLHLLLCNEAGVRNDVTVNVGVAIAHMGPPLGQRPSRRVHSVGHASLSDDQRSRLDAFVKERLGELTFVKQQLAAANKRLDAQYRIHPAYTRPSRACQFWRFSCVGFVLATYQHIGIELVASPADEKSVDALVALYGDPRLHDPDFRQDMGLSSDRNAWPVIFPGHVLNSLRRQPIEIHGPHAVRFTPQAGDEFFPSDASASSRLA